MTTTTENKAEKRGVRDRLATVFPFLGSNEEEAEAREETGELVAGERLQRPGRSGYRGRGRGTARVVSGPQEWQTTTNLGCGFNPTVVGAPAPVIGTPIGRHLATAADVCCDTFAWFREGIIATPSAFVLGLPGLGKSTLIRKILIGHIAQGHVSIVAGDVKGEYAAYTRAMGGQVIKLGHGYGSLNPLDVGALGHIVPILEDNREKLEREGHSELIHRVKEQVHGRQLSLVTALVGLARAGNGTTTGVEDFETMLIAVALRELYERPDTDWAHPPVLRDLIRQIEEGSETLKEKARADSEEEWKTRVDPLLMSLNALLDGVTGTIFGGQTTDPIDVSAPAVCIDVSAIKRDDADVKSAVMIACWGNAFGSIEAAHTLAEAGLGPQRYFAICLDELWQTLGAAPGLVGQIDALTRLNRTDGAALYMITHTFKDLQALPTEEDRRTAMGFVERAGLVICGGLPRSELDMLHSMLPFSVAEAQMITSWSRGAALKRSRTQGASAVPPGRGRFMIKASKDGSPGIPVQTILMPTEVRTRIHDTNTIFDDYMAK